MNIAIFVLAAVLAYVIKPMFWGPVYRVDAILVGIFIVNYIVLYLVFALIGALLHKKSESTDKGAPQDPQ